MLSFGIFRRFVVSFVRLGSIGNEARESLERPRGPNRMQNLSEPDVSFTLPRAGASDAVAAGEGRSEW